MSHLQMWIIYDHPRDYPQHFVARLWLAVNGKQIPTPVRKFATSLADIREEIPQGLVCFHRHTSDEPQVVETWF